MIVAGFGLRKNATQASLLSALEKAAAAHVVNAFATPADKADAPCLVALAESRHIPLRAVPLAELHNQQTITQTATSQLYRGMGSVAEAAALAAAGPGAQLLSARHVSNDQKATCAVAIRGQK